MNYRLPLHLPQQILRLAVSPPVHSTWKGEVWDMLKNAEPKPNFVILQFLFSKVDQMLSDIPDSVFEIKIDILTIMKTNIFP